MENWIYGFGRENLLSKIDVQSMPSLYLSLSNIDRLYIGDDGYKHAKALLSGRYLYRDFSFEMPTTDYVFLENEKNYGIVGSKIANELENIYVYYYLNKKLKLGYSDVDQLFDFEYFGKHYSISMSTNVRDINNYYGVNFGFRVIY